MIYNSFFAKNQGFIFEHIFFYSFCKHAPPPFFKTVQQTHIYCWLILDFHQ